MKPQHALILCVALAATFAGCEQSNTPDTRVSWQKPLFAHEQLNITEEEFASVGAAPPTILDPANSIQFVAATDIPGQQRPGDHALSQWFEIVRPGNGPVEIGRLYTSCSCLSIEAPERNIPAGRRALVEVRIVSPPPGAEGAGYMIFATVTVGRNPPETVNGTVRVQR